MPLSSTNCTTLRSAGALPSSSLQMNTIVSAYGPLVMNVFEPFSTYSSPSRRAVAFIEPNASRPGVRLGDRPRADLVEREQVERPALLLRDRALRHDRGRGEPDRHAHRGDHARRALAQLDDRQQRAYRRRHRHRSAALAALARRSARRALLGVDAARRSSRAAIASMPKVVYSLRSRSYGGRSPCSSSSRCGRISLSTNCRTASRIIFSSSGHSYMARIVWGPAPSPVRQRPCSLHAPVAAGFQRCNTPRPS